MGNILKKVFYITNKYIVLATPLILFSLISTIYMAYFVGGNLIKVLVAELLLLMMTAVFIAGWFNMIKVAIKDPDKDNINSLMKEFPSGVGEYFASSIGAVILISIFAILMLILSFFVGMKLIGDIGISHQVFQNALKTTDSLKVFLTSLSAEQLSKLALWNMLLLGCMSLTSFLSMFYMLPLFFKTKNFLLAFCIGLKDIFSKKIFHTILLYLFIFVGYFVISLLSTIFYKNMIMHFIMTLLTFYYVVLIAVGVFYFYYHNFVKPQIGQNVDEIV
ncbi:MAG: hypothetical protein MJ231_00940 [bacterium]|nr:hypothetical protein [bacterium]